MGDQFSLSLLVFPFQFPRMLKKSLPPKHHLESPQLSIFFSVCDLFFWPRKIFFSPGLWKVAPGLDVFWNFLPFFRVILGVDYSYFPSKTILPLFNFLDISFILGSPPGRFFFSRLYTPTFYFRTFSRQQFSSLFSGRLASLPAVFFAGLVSFFFVVPTW